jgi:hypothetical protein
MGLAGIAEVGKGNDGHLRALPEVTH